nr:beta-galactosidase [Candidatus Sigynarchaeota archaeon]
MEKRITIDSQSLSLAKVIEIKGKPLLPVAGEFHFSRYPHQFWEEEILKMKACGINVIATYIFWIHHEEIKDEFDWTGDRDLRTFVQLCAKHGLLVFLRIGPFCHGECRNGGIPDWMWGSSVKRTANPAFLDRVRILYAEIAKQVIGLLFKDGGPVFMIQLENELCDGEKGIPYMKALKQIARDVGIDVPFYTMTGWGNASIPLGELIPTFGSYPESPWDMSIKPYNYEHSKCWFFTPERDDGFIDNSGIAKDGGREKYKYPYLTVETGPGIQVTYHRRPIINPADVASLALVKLGNGANMLGYYVFHGGTHPVGKLATMQETLGRPSMLDYPVFSYDFQAP